MEPLPSGPYSAILCDPPWAFKTYSDKGKGRSAEQHYSCMSLSQIEAMPVANVAAKDCVLLMWVTDPMLEKALGIIKAWGFTYKTVGFNWAKTNADGSFHMGMGYWTRCLSGSTKIHICHKSTGLVSKISISELKDKPLAHYSVWTHKGWRNILNFYDNGVRNVSKITHRLGDTQATVDHRFAVKRLRTRRRDNGVGRERLHSLEYATVDSIGRLFNGRINQSGSSSVNLLFGTKEVESINPVVRFEGFDLTYELGWALGLYCAEGHHSNDGTRSQVRFSINKKETEFVDRLQRLISDVDLRNERYFNETICVKTFSSDISEGMSAYFSSAAFIRLIKHYINGRGAHEKRLNLNALLQTPGCFRRGVLDGMLDGDGTKRSENDYDAYRGFQNIRLCNDGLVNDFTELSLGLGVMATPLAPKISSGGKSVAGNMAYGMRFAGNRLGKIGFEGGDVRLVGIKDIVPTEAYENTYDIEVEGHSFIADWIVSHNSNPELCLLATRGHPKRKSKAVRRLVVSQRREHSRKPDEVYDRIESLCEGPYLEMWARNQRKGWDCWGNETKKFQESSTMPTEQSAQTSMNI